MNGFVTKEMEEDLVVYQKEKELREVVTARIRTLAFGLKERDEEISILKLKLTMVDKDFQCNLQQLHEKEEDILELEKELEDMEDQLASKDVDINELQKRIREMEDKMNDKSQESLSSERLYKKNIAELNDKIQEISKESESKLQQCEKEREEERQRHGRQIAELESEFNLQRNRLEGEHKAAISRQKEEHAKTTKELKEAIQQEGARINKLKQEIKALKSQKKTLDKEQINAEIKIQEIATLYKRKIHDLSSARQSQVSDSENKLQQINKEREKERKSLQELVTFIKEKIQEASIVDSNSCEESESQLNDVQYLKDIFIQLIDKMTKYNEENQSLNQQLSEHNKEGTQNKNTHASEHDLKLLRHQNIVLKEVVKNMRKKITELNEENTHGNITKEPIFPYGNDNFHQFSIDPQYIQAIPNEMITGTQEATGNELCQALPTQHDEKNSYQCCKCEDLKQDLARQREENYKQLQILKSKIEKLTNGNEDKDTNEESVRLQKLEETIMYLKNRMLNDLKEKLQKHGNEMGSDKVSITDVRMMLLEQKLERITNEIGEAMTTEKETLLKAVNTVKEELKLLFKETNRSGKTRTMDAQRKKGEETVNKLLADVAELKAKVNQKTCHADPKKEVQNKRINDKIKITKHVQINKSNGNHGDCSSNGHMTNDIPAFNSHTNLMQEQNMAQATTCKRCDRNGGKNVVNAGTGLNHPIESIDDVWALLEEPAPFGMLNRGPDVQKPVIHKCVQ